MGTVEDDSQLPENLPMVQIKNHKDRKVIKPKAKTCLFAAVSSTIFTRIMPLKTAKSLKGI